MNETQQSERSARDDLWWDVFLAVTFHSILLVLLLLLLVSAGPAIQELLGDFGGALPRPMLQLFLLSNFVRRSPLCLVVVLVLLWIDAKAYRRLRVARGKKAGTLYAAAVGGILFAAILWSGIAFVWSVYKIGQWNHTYRAKQRMEQSVAPLPCTPRAGHLKNGAGLG